MRKTVVITKFSVEKTEKTTENSVEFSVEFSQISVFNFQFSENSVSEKLRTQKRELTSL